MQITEFREKYPQYNDMSDKDLTERLYQKDYSDMPFTEFAKKFGYQSSPDDEIDTTTGLSNIPLRIKLGFVDNPDDRENLLKSVYPKSRRLADGRLVFKNDQTGKETTIDEEGFSFRDIADWIGMIPELAGGTIGAIGTAAVPIPGARLAGAGAGTALGNIAKKEIGEVFLPDQSKQTNKEYWGDVGMAGAAGTIGEGVGALVVKGLAPFAKKIPETSRRAIEFFKMHGGDMTPAQATNSRVLDVLENIAESSFFGGGRIVKFKQKQTELVDEIANRMIGAISEKTGVEEVGAIAQGAIEGNRNAFNAAGKRLYADVDKLTQGVNVSTVQLKQTAQKILSKIKPETLTQKDAQSLILNKAGQPFKKKTTIKKERLPSGFKPDPNIVRALNDFIRLPDNVPFSYLQQWRSDLMQVGYAPKDLIPGKTAGVAKHLAKIIGETFDNAEKGLSQEALIALKNANQFWSSGKKIFNNKLIKSLSQKDPALIVDHVFKRNSIGSIKHVKNAVGGESEAWKGLKGAYASRLIFKDALTPKGVINGNKLTSSLRNMGKETLDEIFTKTEQKELFNFANALKLMQNKDPGLGGGMFIQLAQAGALVELGRVAFTGAGFPGTAGTVMLTPQVLAQLFTRKGGMKWLSKGLVTKKGTKEAIRLSSRLSTLMAKEELK